MVRFDSPVRLAPWVARGSTGFGVGTGLKELSRERERERKRVVESYCRVIITIEINIRRLESRESKK